MFKKTLAVILVIAMVATMWIAPAGTLAADVEVPTGSYYTLSASEVAPFKAGDTVTVRITVSDIHSNWSLMGLDWVVPYNTDVLELVESSCTSSAADVNAADSNVKWELILNTTVAGQVSVTMLDDSDAWQGTSTDGALWVDLVFTAKADAVTVT